MRLCMTHLVEVLIRCTTIPDLASSWEKSVFRENRCRSEAAIAVLLSWCDKNVNRKYELFLGENGSDLAPLSMLYTYSAICSKMNKH
jgi:hypothetical protein